MINRIISWIKTYLFFRLFFDTSRLAYESVAKKKACFISLYVYWDLSEDVQPPATPTRIKVAVARPVISN